MVRNERLFPMGSDIQSTIICRGNNLPLEKNLIFSLLPIQRRVGEKTGARSYVFEYKVLQSRVRPRRSGQMIR